MDTLFMYCDEHSVEVYLEPYQTSKSDAWD